MTWHLKDRELEKKLIAIDPEFIDKLQMKEGYVNSGFYLDLGGCVYCGDVGVPKIQVYFVQEDLEEVYEYNRNGWNDSRKVTPPEDVLLRAKIFKKNYAGGVWIDFECLIYKCTGWFKVRDFKPYGGRIVLDPGEFVEFRPWED